MIYFQLQPSIFKEVLDENMVNLGLTLTPEIKDEITKDCSAFLVETTNRYPVSLPAIKEFYFFYGEKKQHVRIEISRHVFDGVVNLAFYHRPEEGSYGERLFNFKVFENATPITTPERIVHDLSKIYYGVDRWSIQVAVFDAIENGKATFNNQFDKPVELVYHAELLEIKDESTKTIRFHFLPKEYGLLGPSPTLSHYAKLERVYKANDKKLHRHRAVDPTDLIDMLNDMYYYFEINQLDGLTLLKGLLEDNTSKFDKITANVDNTSYPAVEVVREGYNPRRKYTRYTLNKSIINDLIKR